MATPTPFKLTTALPPADLRFESMTHSSRAERARGNAAHLLSEKSDLYPTSARQDGDLASQLRDGAKRHFHGYVTRFGIGAHQGRCFGYQATVRPWLWFLTRTADCRIFQDQTRPGDRQGRCSRTTASPSFEFKLVGSYRKWVYCVQYRESDFNFVARLLEHEGIYWYFEHDEGEHKLVLVDSQSAHDAAPDCESLPYYGSGAGRRPTPSTCHRLELHRASAARQGGAADYDFERPSTDLSSKPEAAARLSRVGLRVFDYPGDYRARRPTATVGRRPPRRDRQRRLDLLQRDVQRPRARGGPAARARRATRAPTRTREYLRHRALEMQRA